MAKSNKGNAIGLAKTPHIDALMKKYAYSTLDASGLAVGLPAGQMGNSEVGHLNIGAGRVVYQDITAIDKSVTDGDFFKNPALVNAIKSAKSNGGAVHLLGLVSDGGVHSHINHLTALLKLCDQQKMDKIYIHAITDGRDCAPKSALKYIEKFADKIKTVSGRYYTMDRDNRWERIQVAFDAIVGGKCGGSDFPHTPSDIINNSYNHNITDEFIVPAIIGEYKGISDKDSIIFFNFRSDRARQFTKKVTEERPKIHFVCMTQYDVNIPNVAVAFPPKDIKNTLGETLGKNGLTQARLAETEKYAHVTFFFNGGVEEPNKGETRIMVPSPKVATYDLQPEMSAREVTEKALSLIAGGGTDVLIMNFANCDMVGHTGNINATIRAVQTVDECVAQITDAVLKSNGVAMVTADHGNAEQLLDTDGKPFTAHTTNPVPFIIVGKDFEKRKIKNGALCDIAPTMLKILGIKPPPEMDGKALF